MTKAVLVDVPPVTSVLGVAEVHPSAVAVRAVERKTGSARTGHAVPDVKVRE